MTETLEVIAQINGWPQVLVISETWLEPGTEEFYDIDGYTAHHITRSDGYGGLSVYVKDGIRHTCTTKTQVANGDIHIMTFKLNDFPVDLITCYRKLMESNIQIFNDTLDRILESLMNAWVVGDMNINLMRRPARGKNYFGVVEANSLEFLNNTDPEYFTYHIQNGRSAPGNIIDHVASNVAY